MRVVLVGLCLPERMTRLLLPRGGLSHSAPRRHSELDSESGAAKLLGCRPLRYRIKSGMTDFLGALTRAVILNLIQNLVLQSCLAAAQ